MPVILGVNLWTAISHSHPALAPTHGVGTEDLYYTTPPFEYYDTYKFDWFIENGRLYIDYDTGESIIIDYPHVNGNYFYGTIGNFDFRLEYDGGRSVKRQADISK